MSLYRKYVLLIMICLVHFSCSRKIINAKEYTYSKPTDLNDQIRVKNLQDYTIDTALLVKLNRDIIDERIPNIHSLLIYKDGALLYEKYLCGSDQRHGRSLGIVRHNQYTLHDARSISKSVVSACIGIAIQKGLIKDIDDPVQVYLPEFFKKEDKRNRITIRNLLTMSTGLSWKEVGRYNSILNDETKMDLSFNPVKYVLKRNIVSDTGIVWNYSGGNSQVLAAIINKVSGKNIDAFARENLFAPLGINQIEWIRLTFNNVPAAASGLRLTSRELLKFGILYKDKGRFNNHQILDSNWVNNSMNAQIQRPDLAFLNIEPGGYGFQFWTYAFTIKNNTLDVVEAKGNGGQSIFICQKLGLVVVLTAGNYGAVVGNAAVYKILKEYILPSLL